MAKSKNKNKRDKINDVLDALDDWMDAYEVDIEVKKTIGTINIVTSETKTLLSVRPLIEGENERLFYQRFHQNYLPLVHK